MRDLSHPEIERYRLKTPQILQHFGSFGDHASGVFSITAKTDGKKVKLQVIASAGMGWDHLSIFHRYCLHIWRPHHETLPTPPKFMV